MEYIAWSLAGLLVGAVVAWLLATKRAQSELITKVGDADRKTAAAESKAASAEAIAAEVRRQYEEVRRKAETDFQELRAQLSSESEARVRAETEKTELGAASGDEIAIIEPVDTQPRQLTVLELKKESQ